MDEFRNEQLTAVETNKKLQSIERLEIVICASHSSHHVRCASQPIESIMRSAAGCPSAGVSARLGSARLGSARLVSARLGSARLGSARLGSARLGSARLGSARLGSARLGSARPGSRLGSARLGSARLGSARLGSARLGSARLGSARLGPARLGSARLGSAQLCSARLGETDRPVILVCRGLEAVAAEDTGAVLATVSAAVGGLAHAEHLATERRRRGQLLQMLPERRREGRVEVKLSPWKTNHQQRELA